MNDQEWAELSDADLELVRRALVAAHDGPFFEEWEFHTLMGVSRAEMGEVIETLSATPLRWPEEATETHRAAANNALVNLRGYPLDGSELRDLESRWGVDLNRVGELLDRHRRPRS